MYANIPIYFLWGGVTNFSIVSLRKLTHLWPTQFCKRLEYILTESWGEVLGYKEDPEHFRCWSCEVDQIMQISLILSYFITTIRVYKYPLSYHQTTKPLETQPIPHHQQIKPHKEQVHMVDQLRIWRFWQHLRISCKNTPPHQTNHHHHQTIHHQNQTTNHHQHHHHSVLCSSHLSMWMSSRFGEPVRFGNWFITRGLPRSLERQQLDYDENDDDNHTEDVGENHWKMNPKSGFKQKWSY